MISQAVVSLTVLFSILVVGTVSGFLGYLYALQERVQALGYGLIFVACLIFCISFGEHRESEDCVWLYFREGTVSEVSRVWSLSFLDKEEMRERGQISGTWQSALEFRTAQISWEVDPSKLLGQPKNGAVLEMLRIREDGPPEILSRMTCFMEDGVWSTEDRDRLQREVDQSTGFPGLYEIAVSIESTPRV